MIGPLRLKLFKSRILIAVTPADSSGFCECFSIVWKFDFVGYGIQNKGFFTVDCNSVYSLDQVKPSLQVFFLSSVVGHLHLSFVPVLGIARVVDHLEITALVRTEACQLRCRSVRVAAVSSPGCSSTRQCVERLSSDAF